MSNNHQNYLTWLLTGEDDLKLAKVILKEQNFYPAICFHSEQAVEKSLKAFLYYKNFSDDLRTHNLEDLIKLCSRYDNEFLNYLAECKILDRYYVPTRYPDAVPGMTPDGIYENSEAKEAVEIADKIYKFVASKII